MLTDKQRELQDNDSMDNITEDFTRSLLKNKMYDYKRYAELMKRISCLIECEFKFQSDVELNQFLMQCWRGIKN